MRQQLPAASPLTFGALCGAIRPTVAGDREYIVVTATAISAAFDARTAVLTDSGTSALVMALRLIGPAGSTVALPAYACANLTAAAVSAGVRVRLYDVDPLTLGVDVDSLRRVLSTGVAAVVVAHLYGYPVDMPLVAALAAEAGAVVIEDAAQASGGTLNGRRLGSFGPLVVLSFGRGKGMTASGGGALLATTEPWAAQVSQEGARLASGHRGVRELGFGFAQWVFGRPSLYWIPARVPSLRLGEMIYREAREPTGMSSGSAALLRAAIVGEAAETEARRRNAERLTPILMEAGLRAPVGLRGSAPGYLRMPVLARPRRAPDPRAGILRAYPITLAEHPELGPLLIRDDRHLFGAEYLRDTLLTLPVHSLVTTLDVERMREWARGNGQSDAR